MVFRWRGTGRHRPRLNSTWMPTQVASQQRRSSTWTLLRIATVRSLAPSDTMAHSVACHRWREPPGPGGAGPRRAGPPAPPGSPESPSPRSGKMGARSPSEDSRPRLVRTPTPAKWGAEPGASASASLLRAPAQIQLLSWRTLSVRGAPRAWIPPPAGLLQGSDRTGTGTVPPGPSPISVT
jgi:hypothetical protein